MFEEENSQPIEEMDNPMKSPTYHMIKEVRVLLVDNEEFVTQIVDLLKSHDYKVTTVLAPAAKKMLSKGKKKVDVMIINVNSSNSLCFKLLAKAMSLDIISLVVCDEYDKVLVKEALDNGAYLCLEKPHDEKIVKHLRQFVLREKIKREKARKRLKANGDQKNVDDTGNDNIVGDEEQAGEKNMSINIEEQSIHIHNDENDVVSNGKYKLRRKRGKKSMIDINEGRSQSSTSYNTIKRKDCIEWTMDLHVIFTKAVKQLGEGRCYPAEILEVMNVPGLTKKQVASHLQKYRTNNWKPPKERKYTHQGSSSGSQQSSSHNISLQRKKRSSYRKYGTMPHLQTNVLNQTQRCPEFPPVNTNNIFASVTQHQRLHPQLLVQPHYLNTSLSTQNNVDGGLQQHGPLFGSTNFRSGLAFNNGDHHDYALNCHTQNGYSLDLNAAHVTTYSGSAMMSDIGVGNATIDGLGAANANFQQYISEQKMFDPSDIVATSDANCDAYFNFNYVDDLFQTPGSPSATLPNEHGSASNTKSPGFGNSKFS